MSKIFDALQGTRNEVSELLPSLLAEEADGAPARTMVPSGTVHNHAVSDAAPREAGQPPAPVRPAPLRRVALAIPAGLPVLPFEDPNDTAAEQYRIARTKIVHHARRPRVISVTSPSTGDGKTISSINLAGVLSLKGSAKVLLADMDFRRSAVHALLGLPRSPGAAEVLAGECGFEEAVAETEEYPNLHIVTSGEPNVNPGELLESPRWQALIETMRARYEYVVLDTPPVGAVADGDLIQLAVDGVLLVLRPDHSRRSSCLKAIESVPKEKLIGVLLNCTMSWPFGRPAGGYHYGYSYSPGYISPAADERRGKR